MSLFHHLQFFYLTTTGFLILLISFFYYQYLYLIYFSQLVLDWPFLPVFDQSHLCVGHFLLSEPTLYIKKIVIIYSCAQNYVVPQSRNDHNAENHISLQSC